MLADKYRDLCARRDAAYEVATVEHTQLQQELGRELEWLDFCFTPSHLAWEKAYQEVTEFEEALIRHQFERARTFAPIAYWSLMKTMQDTGVTFEQLMASHRKELVSLSLSLADRKTKGRR